MGPVSSGEMPLAGCLRMRSTYMDQYASSVMPLFSGRESEWHFEQRCAKTP
jgi:hypothetical protein